MAAFLTKLGSKNNSLPVTFELPTNFVDWPKGEKGHLLQEVEVALPLQEALDALFGRRAAVGVSYLQDISNFMNQSHTAQIMPSWLGGIWIM